MRHLHRLIATMTVCAAWCVAAATVAYARPDPGGGVIVYPPGQTSASSTGASFWEIVALVGLGALLAIALVGLVYSLRHRRMAEPSRGSEPSQGARA